MSCVTRKPVFGVPTRSDADQAQQSQSMTRGFNFKEIYAVKTGDDQLCSNLICTLIFACAKVGFSHEMSHKVIPYSKIYYISKCSA